MGMNDVLRRRTGRIKTNNSLLSHMIKYWMIYSFLIIPITYFVIFKYIPVLGNVIAFRKYRGGPNIFGEEFVGLKYFRQFIGDSSFWNAFFNTLRLSIGYILVRTPATLLFALLF